MRSSAVQIGVIGVLSAAVAVACSNSTDNASTGGHDAGGQSPDGGNPEDGSIDFDADDADPVDTGADDVDLVDTGADDVDPVETGTDDAGPVDGGAVAIVPCSGATVAQIIQARLPYFDPNSATVSAFAILEFKNTDPNSETHTATSGEVKAGTPTPDGTFDTGDIAPGASVCVQFTLKGVYPFYCKYDSASMQGTITVE